MTPSLSTELTSEKKSAPILACTHCGLPVPKFRAAGKTESEIVFCCEGCRTVYQIITGCSLEQYYAIKKQSAFFAPSHPASTVYARYGYLDDSSVKEKFAYGENARSMDFYIEGVHCVACLWLIERVGQLVPGIQNIQMNLGSFVAKVTLAEKGTFAAVAEGLEHIGYKPHPVCESRQASDLSRAENRKDMIRIGVAGFCMMNIMILFVSIYAGADKSLLSLFRWLSGALFIPVAIYAAAPFYQGALSAFRARQIHIDLPVAGAILIGSAASVMNLITGSEHIYFDSLSAFVFLLLSARYLLKTIHQKTASQTGPGEFLVPKSALRYDAVTQKNEAVAVENICPGEQVWVPQGEVIAVDGEVAEGFGYADFHMISGESKPVKLFAGSKVYAGTVNVGPSLIIRVTAVGPRTRIEALLRSVVNLEKPKTIQASDLAAKRYLITVLMAAGGLVISCWGLTFAAGFDRVLSLIIIACPCALALAAPLAYRLAWRECAMAGALLKGTSTLDKLAQAKKLYLDKTGTLTQGCFEVLEWQIVEGNESLASEAYLLEKKSLHPIAFAVRDYALRLEPEKMTDVEVQDWSETFGTGVSGTLHEKHYEIKGVSDMDSDHEQVFSIRSSVGIFENGILKVRVRLGDRIREDSAEAMRQLRSQFKSIEMITGDRNEPASAVASRLGISNVTAQMNPEAKKEMLQHEPLSLMVGDGANDAAAMKVAGVAVAVQGSIEASFQCADAYLTTPGIRALPELISIARRTRAVVRTTLTVSLIYNLSGMVLALLGMVTPLVAAVVMPLSSFTVLAISYAGLRWRKKISWK